MLSGANVCILGFVQQCCTDPVWGPCPVQVLTMLKSSAARHQKLRPGKLHVVLLRQYVSSCQR